MKFLAKVKKIFNLNKLGNCFHNRSGKSDPRKATPHSESETRLAMPITCMDLPKESVNLPVNPIRERLEKDFESGINMNECIKLLSLSDTELIDQQETLMANYEDGNITNYSSSEDENEKQQPIKNIDYKEPNLPGYIYMEKGGPSNQLIPRSEIIDENESKNF